MSAPDRKVYDSDLARTPLLREIAETYTREYVGNFDMMIEAQRFLWANGELEPGMLRPVLNTLRTDPLRQDLWQAVRAVLPSSYTESEPHPWRREQQRPKVVPIRPEQRRVILTVRARVKKPFGMAQPSGRSYRVVHRVNPEAGLRWARPRSVVPGVRDEARMDLPMVPEALFTQWLCQRGPYNPVLLDEIPEGMTECRKCHCAFHGLEYP